MRLPSLLLPLSLIALFASSATAQQTPSATDLRFDIVSIKPHRPGDPSGSVQNTPSGIVAINMPLTLFIDSGFREPEVLGAPQWLKSTHYDVELKVAPENAARYQAASPKQWSRMVFEAIAQRTRLRSHEETRTMPLFELRFDKAAPKFKPASTVNDYAAGYRYPDGTPAGRGLFTSFFPDRAQWIYYGQSATMAQLASQLSYMQDVDRLVIDRTGLSGAYDFTLEWLRGDSQATDGVSIFTALRDQLGLKLVPATGPVRVLLIDRIEPPGPN